MQASSTIKLPPLWFFQEPVQVHWEVLAPMSRFPWPHASPTRSGYQSLVPSAPPTLCPCSQQDLLLVSTMVQIQNVLCINWKHYIWYLCRIDCTSFHTVFYRHCKSGLSILCINLQKCLEHIDHVDRINAS